MKPFLKWAGNKYKIIHHIKKVLPHGNRLIEPFVGSGAVFLSTNYEKYILSDNNATLISLFKYLKKEKISFINYCSSFFGSNKNKREVFLKNRDIFNNIEESRLKAALFVYLNKHSFNGLTRYNSSGKYNVSFGKYKKPYFPKQEMIYFAKKAKNAKIQHNDFTKTMNTAKKGDVIYCDPPYLPLSATSNFTKYSADGFDFEDQRRLVFAAKKLINQGITVIISNHNTEVVRDLYQGAKILCFDVQRYISCNSNARCKAPEILAVFN